MEKFPQIIAVFRVVSGDSTEVGELVCQKQLLQGRIRRSFQCRDGLFLADQPCFLRGQLRPLVFAHILYQTGHTRAEFVRKGLEGYIGILNDIVEHCGGQHLLILRQCGGNGGSFGAVQNIRGVAVPTLGTGMGLHCKIMA